MTGHEKFEVLSKSRINECQISKDGYNAVLFKYESSMKVHVRFDDGLEKVLQYSRFHNGCFNKYNNSNLKDARIGEISINTQGLKCELLDYKSKTNITFKFLDDGLVIKDYSYKRFKDGTMYNPNYDKDGVKYVGRVSYCKQSNEKMTIVEFKTLRNIIVGFEDGTLVKTRFSSFEKGSVIKPNFGERYHIGEENIANDGTIIRIVDCISSRQFLIEFDDGTQVKDSYGNFISGNVKRSHSADNIKEGYTSLANNGQVMILKRYRSSIDCDIEFEDGTWVYGKRYYSFLKGQIKNPNLPIVGRKVQNLSGSISTFDVTKLVGFSDKCVYYRCECRKCGYEDILTPSEMLEHKCE